jgi:uncharacterized protein
VPRILSRRQFFASVGASLVGTGLYAYEIEPHRVSVVRRELPIANLPKDLDGKLLVQISDLHVGPTGYDYLLHCFSLVTELRPELIVITGDFMTGRNTEQIDNVGQLLNQLPKPPLGIIGSLGNHDYGPTWQDKSIADELVPVVEEAGVKVLRNASVDIAGLQVIGMDELWSYQFLPNAALDVYDPKRAALVLSHNPDSLDRQGWGTYQGWILSGHTHGGQCTIPFVGPPYLPVENPRYVSGEVDLGDGRRVYINRGLGYNKRIRFNARPEITAFALRRVDCLS